MLSKVRIITISHSHCHVFPVLRKLVLVWIELWLLIVIGIHLVGRHEVIFLGLLLVRRLIIVLGAISLLIAVGWLLLEVIISDGSRIVGVVTHAQVAIHANIGIIIGDGLGMVHINGLLLGMHPLVRLGLQIGLRMLIEESWVLIILGMGNVIGRSSLYFHWLLFSSSILGAIISLETNVHLSVILVLRFHSYSAFNRWISRNSLTFIVYKRWRRSH